MNNTLSKSNFRPFTLEDAPAVVDLMNAYSQAFLGVMDSNLNEMLEDWTTPGLDLEKAARVLENEQGDIIGYIEVWDISQPHVTKYIWGIMDPEIWDADCYRDMLRWAEECACERIHLAPEDTRIVMNQGTLSKDTRRKKALEDYGYELVRNFYRMVIELDQAPPAPVIPDGLTIAPIQMETDFQDALIAMEDGFTDHWGHVEGSLDELLEQWEHHIANNADFDPKLWFLAKDGDFIAGVCRCTNKTVEDPDMGWVNQLCVRKPWRRRGLGMALLLTGFNEFYRRGKSRVGLGVDAASLTNATRLYEKAGMHVTRQYDTYEMELRPGKDLSTRSAADAKDQQRNLNEMKLEMDTMETNEKTSQPAKKIPILSTTLIVFMVSMVFANIASEMYVTMLPLYLKHLGADVMQIGVFFTVSQIVPLVLQVLGGWVSDTIGRLRSVAIGSLIGLGAFISPIFVPTWQWLYLSETLNALTRSLIGPSFGAFIAEETAEENRGKVYGITDTIYTVVTVIGPPLAGWLADTYGFRTMLMVSAGIYVCATVIRVVLAKVAAPRQRKETGEKLSLGALKVNFKTVFGLAIAGGLLTWLLVTDGVRDIAFSMSFQLMPLYLEEIGGMSLQQIGWLSSFYGVASMLTTIPAGWFSDKVGERFAIALGFFLEFVAMILMINIDGFAGYAAVWAVFGVGSGLMSPAYQSLLSKVLPERLRGTGFGLIHASLGIFSLPAPAIGSLLWKTINPQAPFYITAFLALVTVFPAFLKFKLNKRDLERAAAANSDGPETS